MERLRKTLLKAFAGCAVGTIANELFFDEVMPLVILAFAGFIFGWTFLTKILPTIYFGGILMWLFIFLVRCAICVAIGWIILLIELLRSFYEIATANRCTEYEAGQ